MNSCTIIPRRRASNIQVLENEIRLMREAQMEQLDKAVAEALGRGIPLKELRITEVTIYET